MFGNIGEAKHLKRNLCLLTEPNQLKNLKDCVLQRRLHRTGEVDHKDDPVILAILLDDLREEDIVMGAVLMQPIKVQLTRLLGAFTANLVRSLLALELSNQLTNECVRLTNEGTVCREVRLVVESLLRPRMNGERFQHLLGADDLSVQVLHSTDDHSRGSQRRTFGRSQSTQHLVERWILRTIGRVS